MKKKNKKYYWSEAKRRPKAWAELGILLPKKQKWSKKNSTTTSTTNFVPVKLFTFLSKFLTFLSLFQPPKTFPHVLNYHNLSKRRSEKFFFEQNFFFQKKLFIFFVFSIFFFLIFFSVCLNSTTRFCILLTKQTKNTLGQNELEQ